MGLFSSQKSFLKSASKGDLDEFNFCLNNLIPSKFSIDVTDSNGRTALCRAAERGQLGIIRALLDAKANLEIADNDGYTPLLKAVHAGETAAARLLIAAGADVNTYNHNYVTPILTASRYGQIDVVKDLIAAHADLNAVSKETGRTGLHWAVENGHTPVVELLLANKARTDILDREQIMPIIGAARNGEIEIVKALVGAGADINAVSASTGRTALHWAIEEGHLPIVEFLLANRARIDIPDRDGNTAADLARGADLPAMAKLIEARQLMPDTPPAVPAAPMADEDDAWTLVGASRVAHVAVSPVLGRKITEVFNFENRERVIITENLKTGAESMTQPEKFDTVAEDVVARAAEHLKALGGGATDASQKRSFNL